MKDGALAVVGAEEIVVPKSLVWELEQYIRKLERILGQKTENIDILEGAIRIGREKKSNLPATLTLS
jgi:transposase